MQLPRSSSLLLCIETSGTLCGIAVADASSSVPSLLAELNFSEPFLHDAILAEAVRSLSQMLGLKPENFAAIAVSAGPGSFTGLRIGAAFAKAFCFENSPKLIAVPTLQAIALAAAETAEMLGKEKICVGIPSHKNLVYIQYFSPLGEQISAIQLIQTDALVHDGYTFYAGTAFGNSSNLTLQASIYGTLPDFCRITPAMIARLGGRLFHQQAFMPSEDFVPLYSQDFVPKTATT